MIEREPSGKWKKGAPSPNPGGRPSILKEIRELAQSKMPRCIELLMKIAEDPLQPVFARLEAIKEINNRAVGRSVQSIAMDVATTDMTRIHETALLMKELGSFSIKREALLPPPVIDATEDSQDDR